MLKTEKLNEYLSVFSLVAIGLLLRMFNLGSNSFYGDEIFDITVATGHLKDIFNADLWHAPLNYYVMFFWTKIFGVNEFVSRLPSVIFSVLAVYVSYLIAKELFDKKIAFLTAFFVAISPFSVLFSRSVRWYSLFFFLTSISTYFMIRYSKKNSLSNLINYVVFSTFMVYCDITGLLVMFFHFFSISFIFKKFDLKWFLGQFFVLIFSIPWLYAFIYRYLHFSEDISRFPSQNIVGGVFAKIIYLFFSFSIGQTILPFNYFVSLPSLFIFLMLFVIGFIHLFNLKKQHAFFILSYLLFLSLPVFTILNAPHYMLDAFLPFCIFISAGVVGVNNKKTSIMFFFSIILIFLYSLFNLYNGCQYHRMEFLDGWREMAKFVAQRSTKDDVLFSSSPSFVYYYAKIGNAKIISNLNVLKNEIRSMRKGGKIFFVYSPLSGAFKDDIENSQKLLLELNKKFTHLFEKTLSIDPDHAMKRKITGRPFPKQRVILFVFQKF